MTERAIPKIRRAIIAVNYPLHGLPCAEPCASAMETGTPDGCAVCGSPSRLSGVRQPVREVTIFQADYGTQLPTE